MSLDGYDTSKRVQITVPAQDETLTDFPCPLYISGSLAETLYAELGVNWGKIAIEIGDTGVQTPCEKVFWDSAENFVKLCAKITIDVTSGWTGWLYYDPLQEDNTAYVGAIGSTVGQSVYDSYYTDVWWLSQYTSTSITSITNSVSSGKALTISGTPSMATGNTGNGITFDASNDKAVSSASRDYTSLRTAYTIEILGFLSSLDKNYPRFLQIAGDISGAPTVNGYANQGYLDSGVNNDGALSDIPITLGVTQHLGTRLSSGSVSAFGNGVISTGSNSVTIATLTSVYVTLAYIYGTSHYYAPTIFVVRISNIARSQAWLNAMYLADTAQLVTYSGYVTYTSVSTSIDQLWKAGSIGNSLYQSWVPATVLKSVLSQPITSATVAKNKLSQSWNYSMLIKSQLSESWDVYAKAVATLIQPFPVTNTKVAQTLEQLYYVRDRNIVKAQLQQPFWSASSTTVKRLLSQYVVVNGETIYPISVSFKSSFDEYTISSTLEVAISDYGKFSPETTVYLHNVLGTTFTLMVDTYSYDTAFDSDTRKIDLLSPTVKLDEPYCDLVTGDYSGMASQICQDLAGDVSITWGTIDWYISDGALSVTDESPLTVIRDVVNAVGAKLQSTPEGNLVVIPRYPKSCNVWYAQPVLYDINYATEVVSETSEFNQNPGYNSFNVSNDSSSDTILRIETEDIDTTSKTIKVFVYPNVTPTVTHTGNPATVSLTYDGYISTTVEKTVEFVSGEGSVDGPIYGIYSYSWAYTNLGSFTYEATGTITSDIDGDSLLDLTYITSYYSYILRTSVLEDIQVIAEADL